MKFVLAFDSFKGCLTSKEIIAIARRSISKISPGSEIKGFLVADGGEGTMEALVYGTEGRILKGKYTNLEGKKEDSGIGVVNELCVIECAQCVGITQSDRKNITLKTSKGMGEQIRYALDLGYRKFAIGLGGSGTNDAGLGVAGELGYQFLDKYGNRLEPILENIHKIAGIDQRYLDTRIKESEFTILSDVKNPLYGKNGATYVYGPQKGALNNELEKIDKGIECFSDIAAKHFGFDKSREPGAGAAGGLGYAFLQFFNGKAVSGVEYVLEVLKVKDVIKDSDIVFTGEGRSDIQTANGKVAIGVSKLAKLYNKPVLLVSGALSEDAYMLHDYGIDYLTSIQDYPAKLEEIMRPSVAADLFGHRIEEIVRLLLLAKKL